MNKNVHKTERDKRRSKQSQTDWPIPPNRITLFLSIKALHNVASNLN